MPREVEWKPLYEYIAETINELDSEWQFGEDHLVQLQDEFISFVRSELLVEEGPSYMILKEN